MLKKLMITTAAGALLATAAWAQSPSQPSQPSTPPAASAPQSGSGSAGQTGAAPAAGQSGAMDSKSFVSTQKPDQWLASKFRGTDVVGSDDQKVGDVSDLLFDKDGKIEAFVVSVGGFLGMGAKDVALPPNAFQVVADTGRAGTTGAGGGGAATTGAASRDPNDIKLKVSMTKDELKNAQAFEAYKAPSATGTGGANRPAGGGMGGGANR